MESHLHLPAAHPAGEAPAECHGHGFKHDAVRTAARLQVQRTAFPWHMGKSSACSAPWFSVPRAVVVDADGPEKQDQQNDQDHHESAADGYGIDGAR